MIPLFVDYDISNCVVHVMDVASKLYEMELNDNLIQGESPILTNVRTDEEMLIATCYIAECFTFGAEP